MRVTFAAFLPEVTALPLYHLPVRMGKKPEDDRHKEAPEKNETGDGHDDREHKTNFGDKVSGFPGKEALENVTSIEGQNGEQIHDRPADVDPKHLADKKSDPRILRTRGKNEKCRQAPEQQTDRRPGCRDKDRLPPREAPRTAAETTHAMKGNL